MKEAKYIKNMFYKTIYKTSEDKYKDAVIAFTTVRYDDKSREELVTLNKIENDKCDDVWLENLSKRISNYDDFINNNNEWKNLGIYKEDIDKVKFYEPESIISEGILDTIDEIEIFSVGEESDNLSFVVLHDSVSDPYCITCNSDNIDIILNKLVVNYDKLVDKGKINVYNLHNETEVKENITNITFIARENEVEVIAAKQAEVYSDSFYTRLPLETGLAIIKNNKNIDAKYVKIVDGKRVIISEEEFKDIVDKINIKNDCESKLIIEEATENQFEDDPHLYFWDKEKKKKDRVKIFAGVLALVGMGAFILWPNSNKKDDGVVSKTKNTSENDKSVTTSSDVIVGPNTESMVYTTSSFNNSQSTVKSDVTTTRESSVVNSESTIKTTSNENSYTTNNGYTVTVKPETKYTGTYRTINSNDMIPSQTGTKNVTKTTTNGNVTYRTVDPKDMVTAPSKAGEQVFTKDGTTTTKKTSTTVKNPYADLIITNDINSDGKTLVLKR